jgi:hypothetical protein
MSSSVGLSVPRLSTNPVTSDGSNVGRNQHFLASQAESDETLSQRQGSLVPPCGRGPDQAGGELADHAECHRTYYWSTLDMTNGGIPTEFGALPLRDFGDVIKHPTHGLIGALVIGPRNSRVCDSARFPLERLQAEGTAGPSMLLAGTSAEICIGSSAQAAYADHVLQMQDAVSARHRGLPVADLSGAEEPDDYGMKAINYRTEPLWARRGDDPSVPFGERNEMDYSDVFSSEGVAERDGRVRCLAGIDPLPAANGRQPCDPETPVLFARPGEALRVHFVHSGGHTRQQGLAIAGHSWNPYPWLPGSHTFNSAEGSAIRQGVFNGFGPMMGVSLALQAGGPEAVPMDYLIRSQASFLLDGGLWGLLRVK